MFATRILPTISYRLVVYPLPFSLFIYRSDSIPLDLEYMIGKKVNAFKDGEWHVVSILDTWFIV